MSKLMIKFFKLIKRIIIHKFWVAYYCFQLGLYWQGIIHDWSKFSPTEIKGAIKYWDDKKSSLENECRANGYSATFLHHRGRNPHHYEYWIHSLNHGGVAAEMPRKYALELICDYLAACRTYGGNILDEFDWWMANCEDKIKMHPNTKTLCRNVFWHIKNGRILSEAVTLAENPFARNYIKFTIQNNLNNERDNSFN